MFFLTFEISRGRLPSPRGAPASRSLLGSTSLLKPRPWPRRTQYRSSVSGSSWPISSPS